MDQNTGHFQIIYNSSVDLSYAFMHKPVQKIKLI